MATTTVAAAAAGPSDQLAAMMSRPQTIGIDRLPVRRMSNEPKEAMNCKSCRKRKVGPYPCLCGEDGGTDIAQDQMQQA
jgi:hypothetical protein